MNIIKRLVNAYATLVMAEVMAIEEVPETRLIGSTEYQYVQKLKVGLLKDY